MMPALAMASLPPLPGLAQLGPSRPAAAQEVELFPAFKGAEDGDWQVRTTTSSHGIRVQRHLARASIVEELFPAFSSAPRTGTGKWA